MPTERRYLLSLSLFVFAAAIMAPSAAGQTAPAANQQQYQMPPQAIADLIDAPPTPAVSFDPSGEWMLIIKRPGLPGIDEVAQPELRLAGLRINPRTNGRSRERYNSALAFRRIGDAHETQVTGLPADPKISNIAWSPDGKVVAFTITSADRITLWAAGLESGRARQLSKRALNGVYRRPFTWLADSRTLIARLVPRKRGKAPLAPQAPAGPVVQENLGRKTPARTYQDLLQNSYDEAVYEYYATAQLARISLRGKCKEIGEAGIIRRVSPAPGGEFILVESVRRPFSYTLTQGYFPQRIEVWDPEGRVVYVAADLPLQDQIPIAFASVPTGRREFEWRADVDATLFWAEALDGGDGGAEAELRDQLYTLAAPFSGDPAPLITLGQRYGALMWGDGGLAVATEWWWKTRNIKAWRVHPDDPQIEPQLMQDRSWEDRYSDPGQPLMHRTARGTYVILTADDGNTIFLSGTGASPEGNRPFLDELDLTTHETTRLFRSEAPYYERPVRLIDVGRRILVTRRESKTDPPNYFLRDLRGSELTPLTHFPDPTPQLAGVQKEMIRYERADGVKLTATLYLPPGYAAERDGPLPMLMWAYPQEYKSADAAGQVTDSPYRFTRVGWWSPMLLLVHGYAVLDDPTMPVVGEGDEEPNDTFVEQLVMSAQAAVDEVVRRGVADPERLAIGGHSYGAFMAANLLAHSDLFRAGLPRSGAYNRTLTPFGFQSEERTFWEAPEIYFAMSPFMHAEKIDEPILLVHGGADNNSGTYPLQSERLYGALKGMGATVRLVMLPHESHSYRARESVMHLLWESATWLDRYVKNAPPRGSAETG